MTYDHPSYLSHTQSEKILNESEQPPQSKVIHHEMMERSETSSSFNIAEDPKTIIELSSETPSNPSLSSQDPFQGRTIGDNNRYLLQTLVGQGGMSKVYQAFDTKFDDRIVAVKLMINYADGNSKHFINDQHLIKRFMGEVKAISRLKHPNIIQIFDFGITPEQAPFYGSPFYVMEYLPGQTLQNLLTKNKIVPLNSLLKIVSQICAGLKEAHQKGIVHRDLKPDNIFLVHGGALGAIIKILDFGIAKNISSDHITQTQLTQEGSFVGTYRYASPEQCRGLPNIDQRTDIYSLGVILYEAISGKNLYDLDDNCSNSEADWMACHIQVTPKPLKEQSGCENLPDELANIVMQCLAKSPENRFSDIGLLSNALAAIVLEKISLNPDFVGDEKLEKQPETSSYQSETRLEVKQEYPQTILSRNNHYSNQVITTNNNSQKISVVLLTAVMTLIIAMVGTIGYLAMFFLLGQPSKISQKNLTSTINSDNEPQKISFLLDELTLQYQQENYQHCYELAANTPYQDNLAIQEWIGKCGLIVAHNKADLSSFSGAIAVAKTIPNTVPNYQEIQDSINIWSRKILDYATKLYQQGNLEEAVKTTEIIPEDSNLKATIPGLISQWEQEEVKHKTIIDNAQNFLNKGQWSAAKQEVEKIPTEFVFWQQQAQPILERANQKINAIAESERKRRVQRQRPRIQRKPYRRPKQPYRAQPEKSQPLPSLRDKLKNTPLLDDDTLRERLHRNSN